MSEPTKNPPHVEGFENSGLMTNEDIVNFLVNAFPLEYLENIDTITYVDIYKPTIRNEPLTMILSKGLFEATSHFTDEEDGTEHIEVYRQQSTGNHDKRLMLEHIAFAVSQAIYDRLRPNIREVWQQISRHASEKEVGSRPIKPNPLDDFCKTYVDFLFRPAKLLSRSEAKYDFFDTYLVKPQTQSEQPLD